MVNTLMLHMKKKNHVSSIHTHTHTHKYFQISDVIFNSSFIQEWSETSDVVKMPPTSMKLSASFESKSIRDYRLAGVRKQI